MINPVWLKTFCKLVDLGHFTQTANTLYMTQSGVSQQIKKLEEQLSTPLLIRTGKTFTLTDAGMRLYKDGLHLLHTADLLEQNVKRDDPYSGEVRFITPGSIGLVLYPFLLDLQAKHPSLHVKHAFSPNKSIERDIASREYDLGIMTQASTSPDVKAAVIGEEDLVLVTHKRVRTVDWPTLTTLGYVGHPDGHHHCQALLQANFSQFEHASQFKETGFSNQIGLILEPVSRGFGFSVLPLYAAKAFHAQHDIKIHYLAEPVKETLYLCQHSRVVQNQRMQYVAGEIKKWLEQA